MKNDVVTDNGSAEDERLLNEEGVEAINNLFASAHANKEKLTDLHVELVDFFKERAISTMVTKERTPGSSARSQRTESAFLEPMVEGDFYCTIQA